MLLRRRSAHIDVRHTLATVAVAALSFSSLQPALADVSFEEAQVYTRTHLLQLTPPPPGAPPTPLPPPPLTHTRTTRPQRLRGELLNVSANSLTSTDGVIPYTFYELPYCVPDAEVQPLVSNLGTALSGSVLLSSPYTFTVGKDETCTQLCEGVLDADALTKFQHFIRRSYRGNLVVDGLPAVRPDNVRDTACKIDRGRRLYSDVRGFAVGSCETTTGGGVEYQINNHLSFTVKYANHTDKHGRETVFVVGFLVEPQSYAESGCRGSRLSAGDAESRKVHYTYSVKWEHAPTAWDRRWDYYVRSAVNEDNNVGEHWLKLTQSLLVLLCLSFVVALILMRTLHVDFNRYNNPDNEDELQEEVGWKLVHGDVFRPPAYPQVFSAFIGTGTQILGLLVFSVVFSLTGIVAPSHRGRLVMALIFLFVLLSFVNGYVMGRMQTMLAVRMWKAVLLSGMAFPGFLYSLWIITEVHLTSRNAANAVSLRTAASLFALWVGVCLPQTVLGASFAYRQEPVASPIPYTKHERPVPPQRWFLSTPVLLFV